MAGGASKGFSRPLEPKWLLSLSLSLSLSGCLCTKLSFCLYSNCCLSLPLFACFGLLRFLRSIFCLSIRLCLSLRTEPLRITALRNWCRKDFSHGRCNLHGPSLFGECVACSERKITTSIHCRRARTKFSGTRQCPAPVLLCLTSIICVPPHLLLDHQQVRGADGTWAR